MNKSQIFGIAVIASAVGLSACGVSQIGETPKDNGAQLAQTTSSAAETPQTPVAEFDPDNFTTEGTKTVETPWGPKEVYDPVQDVEVRAAFKWIYEENNSKASIYYTEDERKYDYLPREYRAPSKLLKNAMFAQVYAYQTLSCRRVETSDCNTSFSDYNCELGKSCNYSTYSLGPGRWMCSVGGQHAHNISWFPIGQHSHENLPHKTQEEQFRNLFLVNCKSYGEYND